MTKNCKNLAFCMFLFLHLLETPQLGETTHYWHYLYIRVHWVLAVCNALYSKGVRDPLFGVGWVTLHINGTRILTSVTRPTPTVYSVSRTSQCITEEAWRVAFLGVTWLEALWSLIQVTPLPRVCNRYLVTFQCTTFQLKSQQFNSSIFSIQKHINLDILTSPQNRVNCDQTNFATPAYNSRQACKSGTVYEITCSANN